MKQTTRTQAGSTDPIRVQLASNFVLLRAGLRAILEDHGNIQVIGESGVGNDAIAQANELHPDILIIDICANDHNTFDMITPIQNDLHATKIIALSDSADRDFALGLLRAGVKGYLTHLEAVGELVSAVQTVSQDQVFLCPTASSALVTRYQSRARSRKRTLDHLTQH
jgi:DNA-binding NarL/FixJ family response regulator